MLSILPIPDFNPTTVVARTILKNLIAGPPECEDGLDNDGDGLIDYPDDLGCGFPSDTVEAFCYDLNLVSIPSSGGSIGIFPGPNCGARYVELTTVYLDNTPSPGYRFTHWSDAVNGIDPTAVLTTTTHLTATANFEQIPTDLEIRKTAYPDIVQVSHPLTYTLVITNHSPDIATGVVVTDVLPSGVTFVSADTAAGTCGEMGGIVTCSITDTVTVTNSVSVDIHVTAPPIETLLVNSASVDNHIEFDLNQVINNADVITTPVRFFADLSISKMAEPGTVSQFDPITYTISVVNNGPWIATNVIVTDVLPTGSVFASSDHLGCIPSVGSVTCDLGSLADGGSIIFTIVVNANAAGTAENTATVTSDEYDPDLTYNTATTQTTVIGP